MSDEQLEQLRQAINAAKSKLWATQECHPNATETLAWEAYEILDQAESCPECGDTGVIGHPPDDYQNCPTCMGKQPAEQSIAHVEAQIKGEE